MTNLWNKLKSTFKCTYTNILIIIILLAFGILLYNIIFRSNTVREGFDQSDIINNTHIFGNFITQSQPNSGNNIDNSIKILLGTVYRVEAVVMNLISANIPTGSNYQFQITYSNNGTQFQCPSLTISPGQSQCIVKDSKLLNTQGSKIYTDTLTITFSGLPSGVTTSNFISFIDVYGMYLGDYDATYYTDTSVNNEFTLTNLDTTTPTPPIDVVKEKDPNNQSHLIHYLKINSSSTDPLDKYVKGLNYYIKYLVPTTTRPTATNSTTTGPSLPILSIAYINSKSRTQYIVTDKSGNSNSPSTYYLYPIDVNGISSGTIYFSVPILANMLIITTGLGITFTTGGTSTNAISRSSITTSVFGKNPDNVEMNTTAIPNYVMQQINNGQCPSVDTIVSNQNLTQQLCDDLENQDRIRMEKIKLEKEKQYLIKLKKQDDEITRLQSEISAIETNRKNKDAVLDNLKLAQFQKQREEAVQLRDAASEKLAQQAKRNLSLAVNLVQES